MLQRFIFNIYNKNNTLSYEVGYNKSPQPIMIIIHHSIKIIVITIINENYTIDNID